jgi:membrane protein YqaA with SNARE-associated domain
VVVAPVLADALLSLPAGPRFLAATVLTFTPVFIANLVFAGRFRDAVAPTTAFAANLLGAMVGGVLEYLALITGYRALLGVAALLYALAWWTGRHAGRQPASRARDADTVVGGVSTGGTAA